MAKFSQQNLLTNVYVEALRQIAPDMGAYVNEVGSATISSHLRARMLIMISQAVPYEPNFQQAGVRSGVCKMLI
jgi:hypothetical protein